MEIVVHDTASAMEDILRRPLKQRRDALREMLSPLLSAMSIAGDLDPVQLHEEGSGFRVDVEDARYTAALARLREAGVWERVRDCLSAARDRLREAAPDVRRADRVDVVLVLGNPDDDLFVSRNFGYLGMGGFPGAIQLLIWPTPVSLEKIGHLASHELHHNVRYANVAWDPGTVTVGEQVVAEGLAEAFVRELAGERAIGPWATRLSASERAAAYEGVVAAVDVAGMWRLPPYVYGDATAERMGHEPVGLPDFAGYAAGLRIADAHLAATGLTAARSVALPAPTVLANAGVPTSS